MCKKQPVWNTITSEYAKGMRCVRDVLGMQWGLWLVLASGQLFILLLRQLLQSLAGNACKQGTAAAGFNSWPTLSVQLWPITVSP